MQDQILGKRCSLPQCRQIDWIPLICKYCKSYYCADHHSIDSHHCSQVQKNFKKVYSCPICQKTLQINHLLSIQQNFSIHEAMDCAGMVLANNKQVCARSKCNKKLTQLNKYVCNKCELSLCLKHRAQQDHQCISAAKRRWQQYQI